MGAPHEFTNPAAIDPETPMKVCWSILTKLGHLKMRNHRGNAKYIQLVIVVVFCLFVCLFVFTTFCTDTHAS